MKKFISLSILVILVVLVNTGYTNTKIGLPLNAAWSVVTSKPEITVGDSGYGTTFADAITILTASGANVTLIEPPGDHVAGGVTVPYNVELRPVKGANLTVADGTTFTIYGNVSAGPYQIITCSGTGAVVFGTGAVGQIYSAWWGTGGDTPAAVVWATGNVAQWIKIDGTLVCGTGTMRTAVVGNEAGDASAVLHVGSTTQGFRPPVMTTTQKNAIAAPAIGLQVHDSTLDAPCFRSASGWNTIRPGLNNLYKFGGYINGPADGTFYYMSGPLSYSSSTADAVSDVINKSGTVSTIYASFRTSGASTSETSSLYFCLYNASGILQSATLLSNAIDNSVVTYRVTATGLALAVTAGWRFDFKWVTPTWATNPTAMYFWGSVLVD